MLIIAVLFAGLQISNAQTDSIAEDEVYVVVEKMPEFPGGNMALRNFIAKNVEYPETARKNDIEMTIYVKFIVDKTGKVINPSIARGGNDELEAESLRVINLLPDFKPGTQSGKAVNVEYTLPISFKLN